ncbi:MAG TPA: TetR/AcrR family transcriptional regulator [Planctomycetota bacterium]|jgi:TetR/AcrR family transcriptional repressor of nem operon|nr:TetR/AcrR family transcriptional regulator [Planctomycetota bacterium]
MRYKKSRKAEAHKRIMRVAKSMIRTRGPEKMTVDALMGKAGLTHGGFYAHFRSRDAMVAETVEAVFGEVADIMQQKFGGLPPREALLAFVDWYLSPAHRDGGIPSCPVVAFSWDLTRQTDRFRKAYKSGLEKIVGLVAGWMTAAGIADAQALAASTLSSLAGTIAVSRGFGELSLSDGVLVATREGLLMRLGLEGQHP